MSGSERAVDGGGSANPRPDGEPGPDPNDALATAFSSVVVRRVGVARNDSDRARQAEAIRAALRFLDARPPGAVSVRVEPDGMVMLDGTRSFGAVIEVASQDRQFIVSSIHEELYRLGFRVLRMLHPIVGCVRGADHRLVSVGPARDATRREAYAQVELDVDIPAAMVPRVQAAVAAVMGDVVAATGDVGDIRGQVEAVAGLLESRADASGRRDEALEVASLLRWFLADHLVLLGCCLFVTDVATDESPDATPDAAPDVTRAPAADAAAEAGAADGRQVPGDDGETVHDEPAPAPRPVWVESGFGVLREAGGNLRQPIPLPGQAPLLEVARTAELSRVHRRVPIHRIDVAVPAAAGEAPSVFRLAGVFTRRTESISAIEIPVLRRKLAAVLAAEDAVPGSYDEQTLVSLFQVLPRDELFQQDVPTLQATLHDLVVAELNERVQVQIRPDVASRTVSVILALPYDVYSRSLRHRVEQHLVAQLDGAAVDVEVSLGSRSEAVVRFLVHVRDGAPVPSPPLDDVAHEVRQLCRSWEERLRAELEARVEPAEAGRVVRSFARRLPSQYRVATAPETAADDVVALRRLQEQGGGLAVRFVDTAGSGTTTCRVCSVGRPVELSQMVPIFESVGAWVSDAVGWALVDGDDHVHEFRLRPGARRADEAERSDDPDGVVQRPGAGRDPGRLADAIVELWAGRAEVDSLNRLVVVAGLGIDEVALLRAYRRYRRQVTRQYSAARINDVLVLYPDVAVAIVEWFAARFSPDAPDPTAAEAARARATRALELVQRLDHDRILRGLIGTVAATVRTNRFLPGAESIALKLDPSQVPDLPEPRPYREVYVYSPELDGIHVRFGPLARGGIRYSDRPDDLRAEVLDLARTQVAKNSLIVPTGAKGAFVVRGALSGSPTDREAAVRRAYERFLEGLLDVTDDRRGDAIVAAPGRVDGDDPYLVVAADKGTGGFPDDANRIALARGFWLGDAFASGGSSGFDHKALAVTSRGAWVAVRHRFWDLGIDVQSEPVTVAGIGDMSGDVFGNGMLRSPTLRLVAAFDHRDIFVDPTPDPAASFAERVRMAALPSSSWQDYDRAVISEGGGVWPRTSKRVEITDQMRSALRIDADELTPPDLIRAILRAPVDLLFAGGVGTFVRASSEPDAAIDDRANADVRIEASTLRARVVCEGANLAFTPAARVEYARHGGMIDADAVDNAAGVDTSDREVNAKILLAPAVEQGELDQARRRELLLGSADEVVSMVLGDMARQARVLRLAQWRSAQRLDAFSRLFSELEGDGLVDRVLDCLPDTEELARRARAGAGLTRPELAVALSGAKRFARDQVVRSPLPDRDDVLEVVEAYFPEAMAKLQPGLVASHPLRRELVAALVAGEVIDRAGITAVHDLVTDSGVAPWLAVEALWVACRVAGAPLRSAFDDRGDGSGSTADVAMPPPPVEADDVAASLVVSLARSYLSRRDRVSGADVEHDAAVLAEVSALVGTPQWTLPPTVRSLAARLVEAGMEPAVGVSAAARSQLDIVPEVSETAARASRRPAEVALAFHAADVRLRLAGLRTAASSAKWSGAWGEAARAAMLDELREVLSEVVGRALAQYGDEPPASAVDRLLVAHADELERIDSLRTEVLAGSPPASDGLQLVARAMRRLLG